MANNEQTQSDVGSWNTATLDPSTASAATKAVAIELTRPAI